eukprot:g1269.t1
MMNPSNLSQRSAAATQEWRRAKVLLESNVNTSNHQRQDVHEAYACFERARHELQVVVASPLCEGANRMKTKKQLATISAEILRMHNWLKNDSYAALGVDSNASFKDMKKSYRRLVRKYHPDKCSHGSELFLVIQNAYEKVRETQCKRRRGEEKNRTNKNPLTKKTNVNVSYASARSKMRIPTYTEAPTQPTSGPAAARDAQSAAIFARRAMICAKHAAVIAHLSAQKARKKQKLRERKERAKARKAAAEKAARLELAALAATPSDAVAVAKAEARLNARRKTKASMKAWNEQQLRKKNKEGKTTTKKFVVQETKLSESQQHEQLGWYWGNYQFDSLSSEEYYSSSSEEFYEQSHPTLADLFDELCFLKVPCEYQDETTLICGSLGKIRVSQKEDGKDCTVEGIFGEELLRIRHICDQFYNSKR